MVIATLFCLGVILGSFVNAFVWRLRILENPDEVKPTEVKKPSQVKKSKKTHEEELAKKDYSILHGRSMCPQCKHQLVAKDLVPVASWLSLKGRCRYCHKPISWQYPLVELLTGALFALSAWQWPYLLADGQWVLLALWYLFLVFFVALAVYDIRWYELPDRVVWPLVGLAVVFVIIRAAFLKDFGSLWESAFAASIIFGLFWVLFQVSAGQWIGGGDVKLAIVLGLLAGKPLNALLLIFLASLIGTLVSLPPLLVKGRSVKTLVPFGPFLIAATILVVLWGDQVFSVWLDKLVMS
jgi:prepilin signal peptidase PulO-like enzyme (type II secretory pathway)